MPTPFPTDTTFTSVNTANSADSFSKTVAILEASNALSDVKFIVLTLVVGAVASLYLWGRFFKQAKNIKAETTSQQEIHTITADVSTLKTEVAELNGDVRVLRGEVKGLDRRFSEYREDSQQNFSGIFTKLDSMMTAIQNQGNR